MNFFKFYTAGALVLIFCTVSSNGILMFALLAKLIALKGALFLGTPIAIGSFVVGQGVGFLAGNLLGGYAVLKGAQKYHQTEKQKWIAPTVKFKAHSTGWGWKPPKFSKGYNKGFHVGSALAQLINKHKHHKGYHDYYNDGRHYDSFHSYTTGTEPYHYSYSYPSYGYSSSYEYPSSSYSGYYSSFPTYDYGGYASSSYSHYPSHQALPTTPSFMERVRSKLPSFMGGASKNQHKKRPNSDYVPYSFSDGSYSPNFGSPAQHDPMNTYYPDKWTQTPGQGYPSSSYSTPEYTDKGQYSFNPYPNTQSETLFEDSEYTYSSSPYAVPQPKRPPPPQVMHSGKLDLYPDTGTYDGPAKEYTGVMTNIYDAIKNMRPKSHGNPMGKPMGLEDYQSAYELAASGSDKTEQILNLASSIQQYAQRRKDNDLSSKKTISKPKASPNHILEAFLEKKLNEKAQKAKDEEQRKEARKVIDLLRKAYLKQLQESLLTENSDEESYTDSSEEASPTSTFENSEETESDEQSSSEAKELASTEPTKFIRMARASSTRVKREEEGKPEVKNPLLELSQEQLGQVQLLYTFMEEIKQFFTLVSALDEDTCLQKMVCDVHAKNAEISETKRSNLSTYESNMISTFRILDAILPFDTSAPEDSSTKYRLASKIGGVGKSTELCERYYSSCAYTSDQIINLGNQVAAQTSETPAQMDQSLKSSLTMVDRNERRLETVKSELMPKV